MLTYFSIDFIIIWMWMILIDEDDSLMKIGEEGDFFAHVDLLMFQLRP